MTTSDKERIKDLEQKLQPSRVPAVSMKKLNRQKNVILTTASIR